MAIYCPVVGSDVVYLNCSDCEYRGYCKDGLLSLNDQIDKLSDYMNISEIINMIRINYGVTISDNDKIGVLAILLDNLWRSKDKEQDPVLFKLRKQIFSLTNYSSN